jgi:UBX domain-containing protein 7
MADSSKSAIASDELVSQFMAFTGSSDVDRAASYLEMSGGSVETAVSLYMDHEHGGGGGGAASGGAGGNRHDYGDLPADMLGHGGFGSEIRAPDQVRTMRLMDEDATMMSNNPSFQLMNAMMEEQLQQASSAFALPSQQQHQLPHNVRAVVNAAAAAAVYNVDDSEEKDQNYDPRQLGNSDDDDDEVQILPPTGPVGLADMFAPPLHLLHSAGGFQGARSMAKDTKRWLLVNIQRDSEFSSHALNRDVWRDELVENLIREGFIFWQQVCFNCITAVMVGGCLFLSAKVLDPHHPG